MFLLSLSLSLSPSLSPSLSIYIYIHVTFSNSLFLAESIQVGTIITPLLNISLGLWILVSNGLLLYTMRNITLFTKLDSILIRSLAVTDIITGLTYSCMIIAARSDSAHLEIWWVCALRAVIVMSQVCASVLQLTVISCFKLIYIKYPLNHDDLITTKSLTLAFVMVWGISFSVLLTMKNAPTDKHLTQCSEIYGMMVPTFTYGYSIFIISMSLMGVLHYYLMTVSSKQILRMKGTNPEAYQSLSREAKARKCFTIITLTLALCYMPNIICYFIIHIGIGYSPGPLLTSTYLFTLHSARD